MSEVFLLWRLITTKVTETGAQDGGHIMTVRVIDTPRYQRTTPQTGSVNGPFCGEQPEPQATFDGCLWAKQPTNSRTEKWSAYCCPSFLKSALFAGQSRYPYYRDWPANSALFRKLGQQYADHFSVLELVGCLARFEVLYADNGVYLPRGR
jgi:hypothetical protein